MEAKYSDLTWNCIFFLFQCYPFLTCDKSNNDKKIIYKMVYKTHFLPNIRIS